MRELNAQISRSGPLHPGQLRTGNQQIGVRTPHGYHTPPALTDAALGGFVAVATADPNPTQAALDLFVALAKAQPFEVGNKRTAIFAGNGLLAGRRADQLLAIPVDEAATFNDLLACAYGFDEDEPVKGFLREEGIVARETTQPRRAEPDQSRGVQTLR